MKAQDNYRVVVYVPRTGPLSHDEMMRRARALAAQVDRHCDGDGEAEVHFDLVHDGQAT